MRAGAPGERIRPAPGRAVSTEVTAEQLSDYSRRKGAAKADNARLPDLPPASERADGPTAADASAVRRTPLSFAAKRRVKLIERDQTTPWDVDKSRQIVNPERRLHVETTIRELGGWLIDKDGPEICHGPERVVQYVRVAPEPRPAANAKPTPSPKP